MKKNCKLTISQACEKYDLNRNTLSLWVRNKKVNSTKVMDGKKAIHRLDEESLKQHLGKRFPEKLSVAEPDNSEEIPSLNGTSTMSQKPTNEVALTVDDEPPPGAMKQRKNERKKAKRNKQNHVQHVKNSMRRFSTEELSRVNAWLSCRLLESVKKSKPST